MLYIVRLLPEMARAFLLSSVVAADHQTLDGRSHEDRPAAAVKLRESAGGHTAQKFAQRANEIYLVTDSLVVASMVGGSGHGAGASCAGYTDHMDSLEARWCLCLLTTFMCAAT